MTDNTTPTDGQGATPPAPTPIQQTSTDAPFYDSFTNPELKTWTGAKGFKSPETMAESLLNMEKLMGAPKERLLKLPEKPDDPGWADVHKKLGVPETAAGYEIPIPEGVPTDFAEKAKSWMHELKIPAAAGKGLAERWNAEMVAMAEAQENQLQLQSETEMSQLKAEWGIQATEKENIARAAAKEFFNLEGDEMNLLERQMGSRKFMETMVKIGERLGEAKFIQGNGADAPISTIAQAQQAIKDKQRDKDFAAALMDKKHINHAAAMAEWDALHRKVAGG